MMLGKHWSWLTLLIALLVATTVYGGPLDPSQAVDVAGSQRMLTQRITKAYAQLALKELYGDPDVQITTGIAQFERNMVDLAPYLKEGDAATASAEVRRLWEQYKALATSPETIENGRQLLQVSETLLPAVQKMVEGVQAATGIKTGKLIAMSGRQRMLSQRMAMFHMMRIWGITDKALNDKADQAHKEFVEAHALLLKEPRNTPEINELLAQVSHSLKLLDFSLKSSDNLSYTIATTTDKILNQMNEVTRLYAALEQPKK